MWGTLGITLILTIPALIISELVHYVPILMVGWLAILGTLVIACVRHGPAKTKIGEILPHVAWAALVYTIAVQMKWIW